MCKKVVLVEGDSDELIFQKAYYVKHNRLPIQDEIEVLSVGLSFKRFLEIAVEIKMETAVLTDNDHNYINNIQRKYEEYNVYPFIKIFYDTNNDLNTLEPQFINVNINNLELLCDIIGIDFKKYSTSNEISAYMENHKTDWALKVFETEETINFPEYITKAVEWCDE